MKTWPWIIGCILKKPFYLQRLALQPDSAYGWPIRSELSIELRHYWAFPQGYSEFQKWGQTRTLQVQLIFGVSFDVVVVVVLSWYSYYSWRRRFALLVRNCYSSSWRLQLQFLYFFLDKVWGRFLQRGIRRDEHPGLWLPYIRRISAKNLGVAAWLVAVGACILLAGMRVEAYAANQQLTGFLARARILMPHLNQNLFYELERNSWKVY